MGLHQTITPGEALPTSHSLLPIPLHSFYRLNVGMRRRGGGGGGVELWRGREERASERQHTSSRLKVSEAAINLGVDHIEQKNYYAKL